MADTTKILKIDLKVDTGEAGKLITVNKEIVSGIDKTIAVTQHLQDVESKRKAIIDEVTAAYKRTQDVITRANELIASNSRQSGIAEANVQRNIDATNRKLKEQLAAIKELNAEQLRLIQVQNSVTARPNLVGTATGLTPASTSPGNEVNQANQARLLAERIAREEAAVARQEAIIRGWAQREQTIINSREEAITRVTQQAALARSRITNQETVARETAYRRLFDQIEAGTAAITSRRTGQGVAQSTTEIQANTVAQSQNNEVTNQSISRHRNIVLWIGEIIGIYRIYNAVINTVITSLRAIPTIGIELESTQASLVATTGSVVGMASSMKALQEEANRTGIGIGTLRETFRGFQASTSLAGENIQATWRMFTNLNTVITGLHLPAEKASGIFLAMAQIFNKTKVQSEELVKQLGNLLPGAFASFAKANEDMFKNSADLIAKMKQGVVFAHDTVEKFTAYLATRFAPSFALASQGLNANIGRMNTSFTLLGEAIYGVTSGPMLTFVKGITSIADYLKDAVTGANEFGKVVNLLANVVIASLIASLTSAALGLTATTTAMGALTGASTLATRAMVGLNAAFAFLSKPAVIIAGIVAIGLELKDLANTTADTMEQIDRDLETYRTKVSKESVVPTLDFKIENDPDVIRFTKHLEAARRAQSEFIAQGRLPWAFLTEADANLAKANHRVDELRLALKNAKELAKFKVEIETTQALRDLDSIAEKFRILALRAKGDIEGAAKAQFTVTYREDLAQFQKVIDEASKRKTPEGPTEIERQIKLSQIKGPFADDSIQKSAANYVETYKKAIKAVEDYQIALAAEGIKAPSKAKISSEIKNQYNEYINVLKEEDAETKTYLTKIEEQYTKSQISINKYYKEKEDTLLRSLDNQKAIYSDMLQVAIQGNDVQKIDDIKSKLNELEQSAKQIPSIISKEQFVALEKYNKGLQEINIAYLELQGNIKKAGELREEESNRQKVALISAQLNDATLKKEAAQALEKQKALQAVAGLSREIADLDKQRNLANTVYTEKLNKINILVNIGSLSQLGAANKINEVNKERIALLQEIIDKEEEAIRVATRNQSPETATVITTKIREDVAKAKLELENLMAEGNAFINFFTNSFNTAFENSFASFITGSQTATEAFKSFATSILSDLAKILAAEIRIQLVKGVLSLFGNNSGLAGDIQRTNAGNFLTYSANGNVFSGNNISAFSGTIVDKPTMFATGGNVMGEAGPEAVLPLKRNSQGKLGVILENSGQTGNNMYNITIHVTSGKEDKPADVGDKVAQAFMRAIAKEEITKAARPGNQLNRTTAFG